MDFALILLAALLPPFFLLIYIYRQDSRQPEPIGKLVKAFFCGVASAPLSFLLSGPFEDLGLYAEDSTTVTGQIANAFWGAAVPEEFFKLVMLWIAVRKNRYFDEHLDGIVYAACVGLGFASIENVGYLFDEGDWMTVGVMRAFMSIPGHFFFAVLMGYFYSQAHFSEDRSKAMQYRFMALAVPVMAHTAYDALLMVAGLYESGVSVFLILGVLYLLWRLRKKSKEHIKELRELDEDEEYYNRK